MQVLPSTHTLQRALAGLLLLVMLAACAGGPTQRSSGEYVDDATITARVKAAFASAPDVDALDVNVDTYQGVVQLSGFADSRTQVARAEEIARGVPGVKSVKNGLTLKSRTSGG